MNNKKHIDRLFQEKFKDFEANPNSKIWEHIQAEIHPEKKKKKRVIPIWFKYTGIAAIAVLFLTIGITSYQSISIATPNATVDKETKTPPGIIKNKTLENDLNNSSIKPVIANNPAGEIKINKKNTKAITSYENKIKSSTTNKNTRVASFPSKSKNTSSKKTITVSSNSVSSKSDTRINAAVISMKNQKKSSTYKSPMPADYKDHISKNKASNNIAVISNSNVQKTANKEDAIDIAINAVKNDTLPNAISHSLAKESMNVLVKDSILNNNPIENLMTETKKTPIKNHESKKKINSVKWSVKANAAPVYYNSLMKGSHIDSVFENNDKSGNINTSYGVNVGYAINDKLKIRSGVNTLNLGYETNNIIVYETISNDDITQNSMKNLKLNSIYQNGVGLAIVNSEKIDTNQLESFSNEDNFKAVSLKQKINYLEIPVELEYAILDHRLGLNIVGGMSTFILNENSVSTELNGINTQIGEVNNINNISFSTNIGLGVDYDFSKAFKLNLEPTFKYQLNAYNNTYGNFSPFILGIYTGISYNF